MARKSTALAPTPSVTPGGAYTITPVFDRLAVEATAVEMIAEAEGLQNFVIEDSQTAEAFANVLQVVLQRKDATDAQRKQATGPLNQLKRTIDSWFAPALDACETVEHKLRAALSAWDKVLEAARREAMATAQRFVQERDTQGMTAALAVANAPELAHRPEAVGFRRKWIARVCNVALMPAQFIQPDEKALAAYCAKYSIDETPIAIPGVIFERESTTIGYRS